MPIEVTLPRIDVDSTTGKIARWLAKDGAAVAKGEPLFEMELEKAAVEVELPAAGTVRDIILTEGELAPIGSVVARIFLNSEPYAAATRDSRGTPAAPVAIRPAPAALATSPAAAVPIAETSSQGAVAGPAGTPSRPRATPLARRLARQHGIALEQLKGSGPNGRI